MCRLPGAHRCSTCLDAKGKRDFESNSNGMLPSTFSRGFNLALVLAAQTAQPRNMVLTLFGRTFHFHIGALGAAIILSVIPLLALAILLIVLVRHRARKAERAQRKLDKQISERALEERRRSASFGAEIGIALTQARTTREGLQQSAETFVQSMDVALARIWTLNEKASELELEASAGIYTHFDGAHGRVPVGQSEIGRIAQRGEPHLSNDVQNDPEACDPEWARRDGLVAFAGYPLSVEGRVLGVVAAFGRQPFGEPVLQAFASVSIQLAQFITLKHAEEENRRIGEELKAKETETLHAQAGREAAETRAALAEKLIQANQELEEANRKLKETQSQLIQTEKMASLGQLVA